MPQFNWRLKFRVVLNLASACWGSGDVTLMRIQLMDRVENVNHIVSESIVDIRELLFWK